MLKEKGCDALLAFLGALLPPLITPGKKNSLTSEVN